MSGEATKFEPLFPTAEKNDETTGEKQPDAILPLLTPNVNADGVDLSKHPSGIIPTLQNIVSTVNLGTRLDLKTIALHARNAEYNPKRFAAVIMRIREPKTTALIFASGKMVCTGAKSEEASHLGARKYARIIQKLGFAAKFTEFKVQNIVGSCDVKFPIRLEGLAYGHNYYSSYEPELFPGLIYRMVEPKIVLLIFVSGKIVLTGAKVREEIYEAFENIYPVLTEYRKNQAQENALPAPTPALTTPTPTSRPTIPSVASAIPSVIPSVLPSVTTTEYSNPNEMMKDLFLQGGNKM